MADSDEIAALPGIMVSLDTKGAFKNNMAPFSPTAKLAPGMDEGKAFAKKDDAACQALRKFGQDADLGFDAYENTARASGIDYRGADNAGAATIKNIVKNIDMTVSDKPYV